MCYQQNNSLSSLSAAVKLHNLDLPMKISSLGVRTKDTRLKKKQFFSNVLQIYALYRKKKVAYNYMR